MSVFVASHDELNERKMEMCGSYFNIQRSKFGVKALNIESVASRSGRE
jgi:hypothetical protein